MMFRKRMAAWAAAMFVAIAAMAGQTRASDTWIKAESAHFVIYSTASERDTRDYAGKLESFRTLTNMLLGDSGDGQQAKFRLYLLQRQNDLQVVRPTFGKDVGGVYFSCDEGISAYAPLPTVGDKAVNMDFSLVTIFHEYGHYVMYQHARMRYPVWYVEGFADFLSTADPEKGTITLGEPQQMRDWSLNDSWIDFGKVLNPDFDLLDNKVKNSLIGEFYAQSWLLTHYMLSDTVRTQALNAYFDKLAQGGDPVASWETATGIRVADLPAILKTYRNRMYYLKLNVPDYDTATIAVTRVGSRDAALLLDSSLLTTCMPDDQGQAVLARLKGNEAADGGDLDAALAVARAELLFGKIEDAESDAGALIDAHPDSFDANYLMGRVYLKESDTAKGQDRSDLMDAARGFFVAAYKINKLDAPNLYFLARSYGDQPGFPDQNAVNAANGAHVLAPGVGDYAMFAAFTDLATNRRDEAALLLEPFVSDPHDRARAQHVQAAIDAIKAGKPVNDVMALLNAGN